MQLEQAHARGDNLAERRAVALVLRYAERDAAAPLHRWNDDDRAAIHAIEHRATLLAGLAGVLSGSLIGGFEVLLRDQLGSTFSEWLQNWPHAVLFLAIAALISGIEILAIYWLMLRSAARIGRIAGVELSRDAFEAVIAVGLARAALEMPNPREPIHGIDPYARIARWRVLAYALLYRLKIGMTSFVLRVLLRRLLARAALRSFIPLIAVPVFAAWNAVVTGWVMREVRIRAAGPQAVEDIVERLRRHGVDRAACRRVLEVVAESVMRAHDAHPNFVLLLHRLITEWTIEPTQLSLDGGAWRDAVARDGAGDAALEAAIGAAVLNGRTREAQCTLLAELHPHGADGIDFDALGRLRNGLVEGRGLPNDAVDAVLRR